MTIEKRLRGGAGGDRHIASNAMTLHSIFCGHFGVKIVQARFLLVDPFDWEHSSFFSCSSETYFFNVHISRPILISTSHDPSQKIATVMCTDLRPRFFTPQRTAPFASSHFFSKFRFWPTSKAKCSSPNGDGHDAHYGLTFLSHRHGKKQEKGSQNVQPAPKMHAKIKKNPNMRSRCSRDREQEGKDTFFFDFGGRLLNRWCSSSFVLSPSAIYSCQGGLEPVLPVYISQNQAKKAHWWCCEPWPST